MNKLTKKYIIDLQIVDDGTMDTVVYDSVSKKTFQDDEEFLKVIKDQILTEQIYTIDF